MDLFFIFFNFSTQCYQCDGVKGSDLPCDGGSNKGKKVISEYKKKCKTQILILQVDCEDKCGLLLEERLTFNKFRSSVISSESR